MKPSIAAARRVAEEARQVVTPITDLIVTITTRLGLELDVRLDPADYDDPEALARDAVWPADWRDVYGPDRDALIRLATQAIGASER